ncbi:MAG: hypothetical protein IJP92_16660 [Lachnospiraceae bacterium]|nr:hypothetical protein [Lachnospiraceae bacterium]
MIRYNNTCKMLLFISMIFFAACSGREAVDTLPEKETEATQETEKPQIITYRHPREGRYAALFPTHGVRGETLSLFVEDRIYEEALLWELYDGLSEEIAKIHEATSTDMNPPEVYVVGQTINEEAQAEENRVYCTREDIENGAHLTPLLTAGYGLQTDWQGVGLKQLVFDAPVDTDLIRDGMNSREEHAVFSCFPAYMDLRFADEGTCTLAQELAKSITEFMIRENGFASFLETVNTFEIYDDWCTSAGVTRKSIPETGVVQAAQMKSVPAVREVIWLHPEFEFRINGIPEWMESADVSYQSFCVMLAGYEEMVQNINDSVPEKYRFEGFDPVLKVILKPKGRHPGEGSYADSLRHEIVVEEYDVFWHEAAHCVFPRRVDEELEYRWISEALACKYAFPIEVYGPKWNEEVFALMLTGEMTLERFPQEGENNDSLNKILAALYAQLRDERYAEYADALAFFRSLAIMTLLDPEIEMNIPMTRLSVAETAGFPAESEEIDGNGLTYLEAMLFYEYLVEEYGTERVLDLYNSMEPFESLAGKTYAETYREFIDYLQEAYGSIVLDTK